ncbi:phage tail assembly protein T [Paraburkholderia sp. RL17-373-BIF-A]|uniref:phage tail assembly protein T n=1 Tax=Paraburkholderia sp. RL17-373-BIF-A TaxID=3031629 RepID=UPI0038BAF67C
MQQRITSAEFVEYMASYQIDHRGSHYDDLRAGTITSMLANINRNAKVRAEPWGPLDFMTWNELHMAKAEEETAVLLDDPDAQSNLLLSMLFPSKA